MSTKAEVRDRVAGSLGRLRIGQSINNALKIRIDDAYDEVYQDLKDDQLVTWPVAGIIPDKITPHLAALMSFNLTADIGVSTEKYDRIVAAAGIAKPNIRRLTTVKYVQLSDAEDF